VTELAARAPAGSDGLIFLPALSGAMAPRWLPEARGVFFGLSPRHGREACARAVLEGCAFAMRDVVDRLDELGVAAGRIRLTGGGARSRLWARIRADVANRPVEFGPTGDAAPLGAAVLAAMAAGLISDISDVSGSLLGGFQALDPEPTSRAVYDEACFRYRELFEALAPLFGSGGP
jgi:xylulokinase